MQGLDMDSEDEWKTKRYCMRGKHVALICAAVAAVGLVVGLAVGLTRPEPCAPPAPAEPTAEPTASPPAPAEPTAEPTASPQPEDPCPPSTNDGGGWKDFRLPDHIEPLHYDLELRPRLAEDTYSGTVSIALRLASATRHLWLHLRETRVSRPPTLRGGGGRQVPLRSCFRYPPQEYVVVEAGEQLEPAPYLLTFHFEGRLNGSLVGFYRTTYVENGIVKSIAATDHEPTDARKSFPCFDEPNKKATYNITIIHEDEYNVLSNMPILTSVEHEKGWKKTTFQKSVPMSTYLVCFAVHQFDFIEKNSRRGIPLRIYAQPQQIHTAEFAANVTSTVFDFFEEYFNMNYSLPKLDQIAIPDFGTGAMENWGLITYRETNLLYDRNESASINKQRVAAVVAHELVHQWFGNIVTMDWWDDLWLNEGFASFFEYVGVNHAHPDWKMLDQTLLDDVLPVMKDDALQSSHPIVVDVSSPAEITSAFDGISYSKGASILRMLQDWITPDNFKKGCQMYLQKFEFQNARTDHFWAAMEEASGKPVKDVMDTWTRQMGYPVLNVESKTKVSQKRFLLDPNADSSQPPSDLNYVWNIPVKWYYISTNKTENVFYNKSETAGINLTNEVIEGDILKINPAHIGFFRVNYEQQTWQNLADFLETDHKNFSEADRAGFFDDAFALASADILEYTIALNLTKYLRNEMDYLPWQRVTSVLSYLTDMLENDNDLYPKFQEYFRYQVKPISDSLEWKDDDDHLQSLLRASVLGLACKMEDKEALSNATAYFNSWFNGTDGKSVPVPVNFRLLVYRYAMKHSGDEQSWNYMFERYKTTPLAQEKDKLMYGLASVNNITLLDRYLSYIYNTTLIKSQDAFTVLQYISYNKYGKTMAWDWVRLNWEYLVNRYTINDRNLGRLIPRITGAFNTELQLWQMENFFEKYPEAGAGAASRKQALETVKSNIEWLKRNKAEIKEWLDMSNVSP
ncbi:glutamyl aminopeptidase [Rhinatrema bivittatum]|uniref:glutamyl aminopeptidase n=1 Tax=Rhinatrema bivittatum TaxID=194408 RepID=UPI00112A991C|nr:glutamyl aminopeptidase [Rhinatrema bivittatum]